MSIGTESAMQAAGVFIYAIMVWLVVYYMCAMPLMVYLMFVARWGLYGFWAPYAAGAIAECIPTLVFLFAILDWSRVIERQTAEKQKHLREEAAHECENGAMYHCSNSEEDPDLRESTSLLVVRRVPSTGRLLSNLLSLLPIVMVIIIINGIAIELRLYRSHLLPITPLHNATQDYNQSLPIYNISVYNNESFEVFEYNISL